MLNVHVLDDEGHVGNEIGGCMGSWDIICEIVVYNARDNGFPHCTEDDVKSVEDDEHGEIITVCGKPYAVMVRR